MKRAAVQNSEPAAYLSSLTLAAKFAGHETRQFSLPPGAPLDQSSVREGCFVDSGRVATMPPGWVVSSGCVVLPGTGK